MGVVVVVLLGANFVAFYLVRWIKTFTDLEFYLIAFGVRHHF